MMGAYATCYATTEPAVEHVSSTATGDDEWWIVLIAQIPHDRGHPCTHCRISKRLTRLFRSSFGS